MIHVVVIVFIILVKRKNDGAICAKWLPLGEEEMNISNVTKSRKASITKFDLFFRVSSWVFKFQ